MSSDEKVEDHFHGYNTVFLKWKYVDFPVFTNISRMANTVVASVDFSRPNCQNNQYFFFNLLSLSDPLGLNP